MAQQYSCPNCGANVPYGWRFCGNCGTELSWPDSSSSTAKNHQETPQNNNPEQTKQYSKPRRSSSGGVVSAIFITLLITLVLVFVGAFVLTRGTFFPTFYNLITSSSQTPTPTPTPTASSSNTTLQIPVITFGVAPATITAGQTATLSWNVTNATSESIDQGIGNVNPTGIQTVSPTATTTYTLTAVGATENVTSSMTLTVSPLPPPVINSFTAIPATINPGDSATLQWNVSGATTVSIDHNVGGIALIGSHFVSPTATTTYTLTATNGAGSKTSTAKVTVTQPNKPTITSFTASPAAVSSGGSTTLSWIVSGATSISIDQGVGNVTSLTSKVVSPINQATTFTLTATNTVGSTNATVTVTIIQSAALPTINSFTANPPIALSGSIVYLSWNVSNATTISINQGIGIVTTSSIPVTFNTSTTYVLTAANSFGTRTASVSVIMAITNLPLISDFYFGPANIISTQNSTLTWDTLNATSANMVLSINNSDNTSFPVSTSGAINTSYTANLTATTTTYTYTLTVTNGSGSVKASASLLVTPTGTSAPKIDYFFASPVNIDPGDYSYLYWKVEGATSISIDQSIGSLSANGVENDGYRLVYPSKLTTYTITASYGSATATASATVIVGGNKPASNKFICG